MAKKRHLSLDAVIGDDVMTPVAPVSGPSGAPVGQHLAQSHMKAKEAIDDLTSQLNEERALRLVEVTALQKEISRLKESGHDSGDAESSVEISRQEGEMRERALALELEAATTQLSNLEKKLEKNPDKGVFEVDPHQVRRSRFANRNSLAFKDEAFHKLKASIQDENGNDVAVKIRPVSDVPGFNYEVVYGHRRHQATLLAGTPLYATIVDISDANLVRLMHIENQREDLSPFEEGLQFEQWLKEGFYQSSKELAEAINESKDFVSQRLVINTLADCVFKALKDPRQLGISAWRNLCAAFKKDPSAILEAAKKLAPANDEFQLASEPEVRDIYAQLIKKEQPARVKPETRTVLLPSGTPLFRLEKKANGYTLQFDSKGVAEDVQEEALAELEKFLAKRLQGHQNNK